MVGRANTRGSVSVTGKLALGRAILTLRSSVDGRDTGSSSVIVAVLSFVDAAACNLLVLCCARSVSSSCVDGCVDVTANGLPSPLRDVSMHEKLQR
jgi:hypothetical protein